MRRAVLVVAVLSAAALASSVVAYAASNVQRVSGPSPYALCTAGAGTGRNYVNTEVEPYLSVNPANPANMIATWQQDRWSNGGAHGGAGAVTFNGGRQWQEFTLPFSVCAPGGLNYLRASDLWVSFGPDGTAYASGLPVDISDGRGAVAMATSHDGGRSWTDLTQIPYATNQFGPDKNSTTADPTRPGTAYTVWDVLVLPTDNPDDNPHTAAYNADAFISVTHDRGATWSPARDIWSTSNRTQTIGNIVVVDPHGTLYDFASLIVQPNSLSNTNYFLAFIKSTDGGATWTQPQTVAQMFSVGDVDPNTGARLRVGDGIPNVAMGPDGTIYAVWQDSSQYKRGRTQGRIWDDEIELTSSADGGQTWSAPTVVSAFNGQPTYTPNVAVNSAGAPAVTYYQAEPLDPSNTTTMPIDFWIAHPSAGSSSVPRAHVAGPFNELAAPFARGYFLGDYMGLAAVGSSFVSAFTATNCNDTSCTASATQPVNAQDIFVATGL